MNLMDINIQSTVTQSNIRYDQTLYKQGLYTPVGSRIEVPYNQPRKNDPNKHETVWKFDGTTGQLTDVVETSESAVGSS